MPYIYGLYVKEGEYRYVGKTTSTPKKRLAVHKSRARRGRTPVACWISKHGDDVQVVALEECRDDVLNDRERWWIDDLKRSGYRLLNATPGGDGGPTTAGPMPLERRRKISATKLGVPSSERNKAAVKAAWARHKEGPEVWCIACRRQFPFYNSFKSHWASIHNGGSAKKSEANKRRWARWRAERGLT